MGFNPSSSHASGGGGGALTPPVTITGTDPATVPFTVTGAAAQANDLVDVRADGGFRVLLVNEAGEFTAETPNSQARILTNDNGTITFEAAFGPPTGTDSITVSSADHIYVRLAAGQELWVTDNAATLQRLRVLETGGVVFHANAAPADAALAAGECGLWYDSTNGASKLMVKAKQADGTVKTAAIALA